MFGQKFEKGEGEKQQLIKNAGIKRAITSKREDNQTPTFYIIVESIDNFITKSQKQGAKKIINKKETTEFYAIITRSATKYFFVYGKAKNR